MLSEDATLWFTGILCHFLTSWASRERDDKLKTFELIELRKERKVGLPVLPHKVADRRNKINTLINNEV